MELFVTVPERGNIIRARQRAYTGSKFWIEHCQVEVAGVMHDWDFVRFGGAAAIVPVLDDGRLVLIRNYRTAIERELLEVPAGCIDRGEDPAVCAARELREETGYTAGRLTPLMAAFMSPGVMDERIYYFAAEGLTAGPTAHESGEQIAVTPMSWTEALAAIQDGRIVDAKTILALLYYARFMHPEGV